MSTLVGQGQNPFAQSRFMAITQLAVFEAVNAITGAYTPYLGTVVAPAGASVDAAAVEAAYRVLKNYFPAAANLDTAYAASLALARISRLTLVASDSATMLPVSSPKSFRFETSIVWLPGRMTGQAK